MHHVAAWYESIDPAGALANINAVADQAVFTSGDDVRVPLDLPYIIGQVALGNDASLSRAQIASPALRSFANIDVAPLVAALVLGSPPEAIFHPDSPIPVAANEPVNFAVLSDPAAAAVHQGLVWFADGPQPPVRGNIHTIRATGAAALAAGAWVASALTFGQTLPEGRYQIVGMRAQGTNLVAARLVFVGGKWRPGVPAVNAVADTDPFWTRFGNLGVFGEFHTNTPPQVECFGVTDVSQVFYFDIIRVGS